MRKIYSEHSSRKVIIEAYCDDRDDELTIATMLMPVLDRISEEMGITSHMVVVDQSELTEEEVARSMQMFRKRHHRTRKF